MTSKLKNYINRMLNKGVDAKRIENWLIEVDWDRDEIESTIAESSGSIKHEKSAKNKKSRKSFWAIFKNTFLIVACLFIIGWYFILASEGGFWPYQRPQPLVFLSPIENILNKVNLNLKEEKGYIKITSPKGGEELCRGQYFPIRWVVRGAEQINIQWAFDGTGPFKSTRPVFLIDKVKADWEKTGEEVKGIYNWRVGYLLREDEKYIPYLSYAQIRLDGVGISDVAYSENYLSNKFLIKECIKEETHQLKPYVISNEVELLNFDEEFVIRNLPRTKFNISDVRMATGGIYFLDSTKCLQNISQNLPLIMFQYRPDNWSCMDVNQYKKDFNNTEPSVLIFKMNIINGEPLSLNKDSESFIFVSYYDQINGEKTLHLADSLVYLESSIPPLSSDEIRLGFAIPSYTRD